jgi:hypothetical protein
MTSPPHPRARGRPIPESVRTHLASWRAELSTDPQRHGRDVADRVSAAAVASHGIAPIHYDAEPSALRMKRSAPARIRSSSTRRNGGLHGQSQAARLSRAPWRHSVVIRPTPSGLVHSLAPCERGRLRRSCLPQLGARRGWGEFAAGIRGGASLGICRRRAPGPFRPRPTSQSLLRASPEQPAGQLSHPSGAALQNVRSIARKPGEPVLRWHRSHCDVISSNPLRARPSHGGPS